MTGQPESGRTGRRRGWKTAAQLLLAAAVTWFIVSRVGVTLDEALSLDAAMVELRPARLVGSVVLLLFAFGAAARLWGRMLGELGGRDPGPLGSVRIVLAANLGRYLPGKVWQMAGLALLTRRAGSPASLGAAAGVLGQGFHLAGAAVVGSAALGAGAGSPLAAWSAVGIIALFVVLASVPGILQWGFRLAFRLARLDELEPPRPDSLFGPRWVLLHTLVWVVYGLAFVLLVRGLGFDDAGAGGLAAAFSAAYLLGYLAIFAPAGIGVREAVLIALVRPSLGPAAVGVAVLARVWMTLAELVPAGVVAIWEIFRRRREPTSEPGGSEHG